MKVKTLLVILMYICLAGTLAQAGSPPSEKDIFKLFKDMEQAWNAQDSRLYMTYFHKDLKLKLGKPGSEIYYSWNKYADVLPDRMKKFGPYKMVEPEILRMDGTKAKAKVIVRKKSRDYKNVFNMVWNEDRWQITSNEW